MLIEGVIECVGGFFRCWYEAVALGVGQVTMVNTYYFGNLMKKKPELPLAIFWPNQESSGVHMNVSGAGLTVSTKHPEEALALLEWLSGSGDEA
jgi:iron(III) transport system substrate-binding protein